jgi:hypothetical protein
MINMFHIFFFIFIEGIFYFNFFLHTYTVYFLFLFSALRVGCVYDFCLVGEIKQWIVLYGFNFMTVVKRSMILKHPNNKMILF